jgi:hypothetical protein
LSDPAESDASAGSEARRVAALQQRLAFLPTPAPRKKPAAPSANTVIFAESLIRQPRPEC